MVYAILNRQLYENIDKKIISENQFKRKQVFPLNNICSLYTNEITVVTY